MIRFGRGIKKNQRAFRRIRVQRWNRRSFWVLLAELMLVLMLLKYLFSIASK